MTPRIARYMAASLFAVAGCTAHASDDDAPIRFDITRFEIVGNTLLSAAALERAVAPHVGKARDFGDVQRALEAVEAAYHERGYKIVTVRLPEQELNRGVVQLNVIQSKIGRVTVNGNRHVDDANVRASLPTLREGVTPNLDAVSSSLRMANDNPARKINLQLQGAAEGDAVDARLIVSDTKPWKLMLNIDNAGSAATGKTQAGVVLQHANLGGRDHVGSLQYTTTLEEPSRVSVFGAGYHIPLYLLGDSVDLYASYSDIDSGLVSAGVLNLGVSGKGAVYGARYNHTLARRGELDARLVLGADVKAFKNSVLFGGEDFGNDVTVRPLSIAYVASRPVTSGEANAALTLVRNVAGGSRGGDADFARTRVGAKPAYTILRFSSAITRRFGSDWMARVLLNGQLSRDALVPGEQFSAGGNASVRGFDERAVALDSGIFTNAELYTPNLCAPGTRLQCRALAFYDGATGTRNQALPGEVDNTTLGSVGIGARVSLNDQVSIALDYGHVLEAGATDAGRGKLHIRLGFAY